MLVIIDGVRADTLRLASTPNLDRLAAEGSFTWNAITTKPSITIAAIPAIFTGAPPEVHKVIDWDGEIYAETVVEVFEEAGLPCAIVGQDPILGGYKATWCTGYFYYPDQAEHFTTLAIEYLEQYEPFFLAVYNPVPDRAGHEYGHQSDEYVEAIEEADRQVGRLVQAMERLGVFEQTLIVVTTDHGMTGFTHSTGAPTDMRVWSIWRGPGVKENYEMEDLVFTAELGEVAHRAVDVAPTLAALVEVRPPADAQGRVITQILEYPKPFLAILDRAEAEVKAGENLSFRLTLTNLKQADNFKLEVVENGWPLELVPSELELGRGESKIVRIHVEAPPEGPPESIFRIRVASSVHLVELELRARSKSLGAPSGTTRLVFVAVGVGALLGTYLWRRWS